MLGQIAGNSSKLAFGDPILVFCLRIVLGPFLFERAPQISFTTTRRKQGLFKVFDLIGEAQGHLFFRSFWPCFGFRISGASGLLAGAMVRGFRRARAGEMQVEF